MNVSGRSPTLVLGLAGVHQERRRVVYSKPEPDEVTAERDWDVVEDLASVAFAFATDVGALLSRTAPPNTPPEEVATATGLLLNALARDPDAFRETFERWVE